MFYRIFDYLDEPRLTGPKFLRLAQQLPRYDGAVRRRIEMEQMEKQQDQTYEVDETGFTRGESMSMTEALARTKGSDQDVLNALNREAANSPLGALFEYETA